MRNANSQACLAFEMPRSCVWDLLNLQVELASDARDDMVLNFYADLENLN